MNDLQKRLVIFSVSILRTTEKYSRNLMLQPLIMQLNRSATSIGANYSESQSSGYPRDFHHKIRIALKEAKETEYWLEVLNLKLGYNEELVQVKDEAIQLIKILTVISKKTKPKYKS